jgi:hypothetical protein
MKKATGLAFILVCFLLMAQAQTETPRHEFFVTAGPSFPIGKYSSKEADPTTDIAYGKTGVGINAGYTFLFNDYIGATFQAHFQRNPFDVAIFETYLTQQTGYPGWKANEAALSFGSLLLGPKGQLAIDGLWDAATPRLYFTGKALFGGAFVRCPELYGYNNSSTAKATITQEKVSASGFAYLLSPGFKYRLSNTIALTVEGEFFKTGNLHFKDIRNTVNGTLLAPNGTPLYTYSNSSVSEKKQSLATLNATAGIIISLQ